MCRRLAGRDVGDATAKAIDLAADNNTPTLQRGEAQTIVDPQAEGAPKSQTSGAKPMPDLHQGTPQEL